MGMRGGRASGPGYGSNITPDPLYYLYDHRLTMTPFLSPDNTYHSNFGKLLACSEEIVEKSTLDCAPFDEASAGDRGIMTCGPGERILVEKATFGRQSTSKCSAGNGQYEAWRYEVCDKTHDATYTVKSQCDGEVTCTYRFYGKISADPCVGTHKYVEIDYICVPYEKIEPTPGPSPGPTPEPAKRDPEIRINKVRDNFNSVLDELKGTMLSKQHKFAEQIRTKFEKQVNSAIKYYRRVNPKCNYWDEEEEEDDVDRYHRDDPCKGVKQLATAVSKWANLYAVHCDRPGNGPARVVENSMKRYGKRLVTKMKCNK